MFCFTSCFAHKQQFIKVCQTTFIIKSLLFWPKFIDLFRGGTLVSKKGQHEGHRDQEQQSLFDSYVHTHISSLAEGPKSKKHSKLVTLIIKIHSVEISGFFYLLDFT